MGAQNPRTAGHERHPISPLTRDPVEYGKQSRTKGTFAFVVRPKNAECGEMQFLMYRFYQMLDTTH